MKTFPSPSDSSPDIYIVSIEPAQFKYILIKGGLRNDSKYIVCLEGRQQKYIIGSSNYRNSVNLKDVLSLIDGKIWRIVEKEELALIL